MAASEVPPIPDEIRSAGGEDLVVWLVEKGHLTEAQLAALSARFGDRAKAAATVEVGDAAVAVGSPGVEAPTAMQAARELAPELEARLRASFEQNMAMWRELGVFTPERQERGYQEPTFEKYRKGFARHQAFAKPGRSGEFDKGYDTVNFVPMDVPLVSEDPEDVTMLSLLERTLREEFARAGDDKPANSLVIKTRWGQRTVRTADQVNLAEILWTWKEGYLQQAMVHRPTTLTKKDHGGLSETDLLSQGTVLEQKNGGFMRLERPSLMLPQDLRMEIMSAADWKGEIGKSIPSVVELQTAHDGIAFMIQFIRDHHYIPDAWTGEVATSQVALMPETFFPNEASSGAVAAAFFNVVNRRFLLVRNLADFQYSHDGVRGGVRMNEN